MLVKLSHESFTGINISQKLIYEASAGNVVRVAAFMQQEGRIDPSVIYQLEPPIATTAFLQKWPEAREVIAIMADASLSNPNVITEPTPNATAFTVSVTTITTAGTPQQLPSTVIPDGRALVVVSNVLNDPKKHVYVATSSANALLPASRITLSPGNSVKLYVDNADKVWVDTDLSGQKVDVIVEQ